MDWATISKSIIYTYKYILEDPNLFTRNTPEIWIELMIHTWTFLQIFVPGTILWKPADSKDISQISDRTWDSGSVQAPDFCFSHRVFIADNVFSLKGWITNLGITVCIKSFRFTNFVDFYDRHFNYFPISWLLAVIMSRRSFIDIFVIQFSIYTEIENIWSVI